MMAIKSFFLFSDPISTILNGNDVACTPQCTDSLSFDTVSGISKTSEENYATTNVYEDCCICVGSRLGLRRTERGPTTGGRTEAGRPDSRSSRSPRSGCAPYSC